MESVSAMEVKFLWGNYFFDHIISEASGNSGGILCAWDTNFFKKDHHTISDNFIALYGTWIPNNQKLLIISVYAPQSVSSKRMLWSYLESLITSWNGESLIMGDFNEVRCIEERWGSVFNSHGANAFNSFISNSGLNDIQLEGFSFTWAHPSATKMSKLDRFLMSNGLLSAFPLISAICLDHHLSDHKPILLKEVFFDFGPTPFCFYHSWLELPGFDDLVSKSWNSFTLDDSNGLSKDLKSKLCDIDKVLDQGGVTDDILLSRLEVLKQLHDVQSSNNRDIMQKAVLHLYFMAWGCIHYKQAAENVIPKQRVYLEHISTDLLIVDTLTKGLPPKAFTQHVLRLGLSCIINEILARCKLKKQQAMIFKVDFAKAYDSVRWDYLDDVLISFGFGPKWRSWIRGSLSSGKASILVNGSPTTEFHLYRGLKQGDPLAPFLLIDLILSHLFYADDAVFIGEWSHSNLKGIMNILRCFSLLSGMSINIQKSHLLGVGIPDNCVAEAAKSIGCLIMKAPFKYLGILVGDNMSSKKAWDETINKMKKRLSRWKLINKMKKRLSMWKLNTLSIGGRLTLLKSVLGSTPIYNMSIFKVPKSVLNYMESLRRNFFNGFQEGDRKIAWVKWSKVLASKKFGGLGVSSFFALNRALLFKWVWRYLSHDNSLWSRIISALHGLNGHVLSAAFNSTWSSIITEVQVHSFWKDLWIGDNLLKLSFPRLFALEENKDISVADKMNTSISSSFRRHVRGGVESQQLDQLSLLLDTVILYNMDDIWFLGEP
ncbi:RNA-directed DNA polymerase, eukaryota [Tanacetum coccineum]